MDEGQHTRNSLLRLRSELAGEIEALQDQTRLKIQDLAHVDSVLRLIEPEIEFADVRPKVIRPDPKKFRGEVQGFIFDEIRERGQAASHELVDRLMRERGLEPSDVRARAIIGRRVKDRLGALKKSGKIETVRATHNGQPDVRVWKVAAG